MARGWHTGMKTRFNRHSERLIERFGEKVWRLGLDAGFSCPHRLQGRGKGGCSFCPPDAAIAAYQHDGSRIVLNLDEQIARAVAFTRYRYKARLFFLYFQAYTNTYLPVGQLRALYDHAIAVMETIAPGTLRGLVISTRPDCIDMEKVELIASYQRQGLEVWLELGLQSAHDQTLKRINRGHTVSDFVAASKLAHDAGVRRAVHVILGLPGENRLMMLETMRFLQKNSLEGIKFHDLRLAKGSALERSYRAGEFAPLHPDRLPPLLADCLELLPASVEVLRLSSDFSRDSVLDLFPHPDKNNLYMAVEAELARRNSFQGRLVE